MEAQATSELSHLHAATVETVSEEVKIIDVELLSVVSRYGETVSPATEVIPVIDGSPVSILMVFVPAKVLWLYTLSREE